MTTHSTLSTDAQQIWLAGVAAAHAGHLVQNQISIDGDELTIGDSTFAARDLRRVFVMGGGKATAAMATGLMQLLGDWCFTRKIHMDGQIHVPQTESAVTRFDATGETPPPSESDYLQPIDVRPLRPVHSNFPSEQVVSSSRELLQRVGQLGGGDLCITLISGGGSALLCDPVMQTTLDDQLVTIHTLTENGADIRQLNTVRRCIDQIKAGGLASACKSEFIICLVLSDVIGDDLSLVASGPTWQSERQFSAALRIVGEFDPQQKIPPNIRQFLLANANQIPPAVDQSQRVAHTVIGNVGTAVAGAVEHARAQGYHVISEVARPPEPLQTKAQQLVARLAASSGKTCLISGGEPTLTLAPLKHRGMGGRNQQFALEALRCWQDCESSTKRPFCLLSAGTDGEDATTAAAGAWCDNRTATAIDALQADINDVLNRNDSSSLLAMTGSLFVAAPTHTNVCDLRVFISNS